MTDQPEKIRLFDDDEELQDNDDFKIRPQYEGPHGQQLLELNSELSKRFKLDERFAEDSELEGGESDEKDVSEENEERERNIKILESVLGHEIHKKSLDKTVAKKKQIRFDPEDENSSKLIKQQETPPGKLKKSKKRKVVPEEKIEPEIPVSTERYIEVCPNLKEILNTATPFSFSQKFGLNHEEAEDISPMEVSINETEEKETQKFEKKIRSEINVSKNLSTQYFTPKTKYESFFITKGDPRLKEGIEFFKRPKPLDEIREEWQKRRDYVLELFRKKRRSSLKSHSSRVQNLQMKNAIRKNNFKT